MSTQIDANEIRRAVGTAFTALRLTGRTQQQARDEIERLIAEMIEHEQQTLFASGRTDPPTDQPDREVRYEAREWLDTNPNPTCFASNYWEKDLIRSFVEELYALGAELVEVGNVYDEPWRMNLEGGPYADELYVTLSSDLGEEQETYITQVLRRHSPDELDEARDEQGRTVLRAWWD